MLPVIPLIVAAFILSIILVVFTVIEWFHLISLSSTISNLESIVEKKSQEFDQLRRERTAQRHAIILQEPVSIDPTPECIDNTSQIQIIRNVHGTFKDTSHVDLNTQTITSFEENSTTQTQDITLYLYSDVSKDADFNSLWNSLSTYLNSDTIVAVTIDFTGIDFIYENEIQYLEQILKIVENKKGSMVFINCSYDVTALMQSYPRLLSRIKY